MCFTRTDANVSPSIYAKTETFAGLPFPSSRTTTTTSTSSSYLYDVFSTSLDYCALGKSGPPCTTHIIRMMIIDNYRIEVASF